MGNPVIRVKEIIGTDPANTYTKVSLMKYSDFVNVPKQYGHKVAPYPYKWYDPRKLTAKPVYYLLRAFRSIPTMAPVKADTISNSIVGIVVGLAVLLIGHYVFGIG